MQRHSQNIISRIHVINLMSLMVLTSITWLESPARFLHCRITSSLPFSYGPPWKLVTKHSSQYGELCSTCWGAKQLWKLFTILLYGRFVSPLSCLFIFQLFIYMDSWKFNLDFGLFIHFVPALISGSSHSLLCLFDMTYPFFFFFEHLLGFWTHKMLQARFVYSILQSQNQSFLRSPDSLYWRMILTPKSGLQAYLLLLEHHCFQTLSEGRAGKYIACTNPNIPVYTHIHNYVCLPISIYIRLKMSSYCCIRHYCQTTWFVLVFLLI